MNSFGTPVTDGQLALLNFSKREAADWPLPLLNLSIRDVTEALMLLDSLASPLMGIVHK